MYHSQISQHIERPAKQHCCCMANTAIAVLRIFLVILMMSTLFMTLLQARSLEKHLNSQRLLHELCSGQHFCRRRYLQEDRLSPGGPNGQHHK